MSQHKPIVVLGTFDSKGEEHLFLKNRIQDRGFSTLTINIGTHRPPGFTPDRDLFHELQQEDVGAGSNRDEALSEMARQAKALVLDLYQRQEMGAIISAGGGTGTYLASQVMQGLPVGVPKVIVSTVASRDMAPVVGTKDITMMHSVADILGLNTMLKNVLDRAAAAVCGMATAAWEMPKQNPRVALTMFGFITEAAERIKGLLASKGYEVVAFHANGTGGMAMEDLTAEGYFDGILDLALHELADEMKQGYCAGIGPARLNPDRNWDTPRLVVPGGLDCAVLEFTRDHVPEAYTDRKIFFYDFRSAIGLDLKETLSLADQVVDKLNRHPENIRVLVPMGGWSEADRNGGPLGEMALREAFVTRLQRDLMPQIRVDTATAHINDEAFCRLTADTLHDMIVSKAGSGS